MKLPFDPTSTEAVVVEVSAFMALIEPYFKPIRKMIAFVKEKYKNMVANSTAKKVDSLVTAVQELKCTLTDVSCRVNKVAEQVFHNGGSSMRDDVTYLRQEVKALALAHNTSIELADDGLFRCTADGRVYLVNTAYANLLGTTKEQILDMEWTQWVDDPNFEPKLMKALERGTSLTTETFLKNTHGKRIKVKIKVAKQLEDFEGRVIEMEQK